MAIKLQKRELFLLLIIFTISFLIRFYISDYTKLILLYPDELRYAQLAENFAYGRGFLLYNQATDYQKILYPLTIAPAFFLETRALQQHALAFINAFWVCCTVFPCFFIARLLLSKPRNIWGITLLSTILPDLSFSLSWMSEVLFLPLALCLFYLFLKYLFIEKPSIFFNITIGVFCYLLYLCKEIALVFPLSFFILILILKQNRINQIKNCLIISAGFIIPFLLMKCFVFQQMGNSYNQFTSPNLLSTEHIFYFFYGMVYYFIYITIALLFFPLFMPMVFWNNLNKQNKSTFLFILLLILNTAIVVSYTIYIREDLDNLIPRTLIRYLTYIWLPTLIVFLSLSENKLKQTPQKSLWFLVAIPLIIILTIFRGSLSGFMDYNILALLDIRREPTFIPFLKYSLVIFFIVFLFFFQKYTKKITNLFFFILAAIYLFCHFEVSALYHKHYGVMDEEKTAIFRLEDFVKNNPNKTFLFANTTWDRNQGLVDAFLNYPNFYVVHISELMAGLEKPVSEKIFPLFWAKNYYNLNPPFSLNAVDFIVLPQNLNLTIPNAKNENYGAFEVFYNKNAKYFPKIEFKD